MVSLISRTPKRKWLVVEFFAPELNERLALLHFILSTINFYMNDQFFQECFSIWFICTKIKNFENFLRLRPVARPKIGNWRKWGKNLRGAKILLWREGSTEPNKLQKIKNFLVFQGSPFCFFHPFPIIACSDGKNFYRKSEHREGYKLQTAKVPWF